MKRKIKVLYINPTGDLYGASRVLLRVLTSLDRNNYEPFVVLPENGVLVDALKELNISVVVIPYLSVIRRQVFRSWRIVNFLCLLFPSIIHLWWLIQRNHIDLVHTNSGVVFTPAISAWLSRVPHIWHLHEMFSEEFPRLWRYFQNFILHFSDRVLCVSTPIAQQFSTQSKIQVLYNGIDLTEFDLESTETTRWREKYCSDSDHLILVGIVGRISPRKGQDVLIKAVFQLKAEGHDNIRLLIIGDAFAGNEYLVDELRAFVNSQGLEDTVIFTGFIKNPLFIMAALDILVLPSILPEAFPTVVLEAMALKIPVIATNVGGTVEQIVDKETGILVSPGSPNAIAEAIKLVLTDFALRERLQEKGRKQIETQFSLQTMRSQLEATYQKLFREKI
jgi:glycosyltransferase involved in cell wall biosynthesis